MVGDTDLGEIVYEVMDEVQSVRQMVSWLVSRVGGDPQEIGRLPDEERGERKAA